MSPTKKVPEKASMKSKWKQRRALLLKVSLRTFRYAVFLGCFGFVAFGWIQSGSKYFSYQTAVSIVKNESRRFLFPSVSFCPKFKNNSNLITDIIKPAMEAGNLKTFDEIDFDSLIEPWVNKRTDFLQVFSHNPTGHPERGVHILTNETFWTVSIPHVQYSGLCYTYTPTFTSKSSVWNGLRMGFFFEDFDGVNMSAVEKEELLSNVDIFFHDKGSLFFSKEDDRPSHLKVDTSHLRYMRETRLALTFKRYTALDTEDRRCSDDPNYDLQKCIETFYSRERGCQPPWHFYPDIDIPVCNDLQFIVDTFGPKDDDDRGGYYAFPYRSTSEIAAEKGCPMPCTTSHWGYDIEYRNIRSWMNYLDGKSEWIVYLWFKNFFFQYEQEYVICDYTCLLGEIGGNLGFFLGGSVLAYMDTLMNPIFKKYKD